MADGVKETQEIENKQGLFGTPNAKGPMNSIERGRIKLEQELGVSSTYLQVLCGDTARKTQRKTMFHVVHKPRG